MARARVTRKDVNEAFEWAFYGRAAIDVYGATENFHNAGRYILSYASCYGGYRVDQYSGGERGYGEAMPFGPERRPAREMLAWLEGVAIGRKGV